MAKIVRLDLKLILSNSFPFSLSLAMHIRFDRAIFNFQCMYNLYCTAMAMQQKGKERELMILNLRAIFTRAALFVILRCSISFHETHPPGQESFLSNAVGIK